MPIVRLPLGETIASRDSSITKDSLLLNCYPEKESGETVDVVRRFGYQSTTQFTAGQARGLYTFGTQTVSVIGTTARLASTTLLTVDGNSQYQFSLTGAATGFVLKNNAAAYFYNGTALARITDANYPAATVPGVVQLDGTTYVMTPDAKIYNSNVNAPTTYNALNFISASNGPDTGVALSKHLNYVVAFCSNTTTFLYDNANPTGSPLLPNTTATLSIGCASATSVVQTKNTVIWIGQTKQRGRSVYTLNGLNAEPISDTYIDRILNSDPLTTVYAYFIEINGHYLYILTLVASNVTIVYDIQTGKWHSWTSSKLSTAVLVTGSSVNSAGVVTLTAPKHNLINGAVVNVQGTGSSQYFGDFLVNVQDANTLFYNQGATAGIGVINAEEINKRAINVGGSSTAINSLGVTDIIPYVQNYFAGAFYTYANNVDSLLDETSGTISKVVENVANDNGMLIYMSVRSETQDNGSNERKFISSMEVIADKVQGTAYLGYTDDDYVTYSYYRPVNLIANRSQLRRCGSYRRRAFQIIYFGRQAVRFYSLELNIEKGTM